MCYGFVTLFKCDKFKGAALTGRLKALRVDAQCKQDIALLFSRFAGYYGNLLLHELLKMPHLYNVSE
jgi:hypothetical protein